MAMNLAYSAMLNYRDEKERGPKAGLFFLTCTQLTPKEGLSRKNHEINTLDLPNPRNP
jgi:hypothetical protein